MQNLLPIKLSDGRMAQAGFRLKRLEMFNWGTFHGKVERLIPDNRWTLIAGRSGAGKSTAADALRTLLVPPAKVTYNDASADNKASRDRTKKTYIRGVYGTQSQESSVKGVWQTHRQEGEQSIILAVFENEYTGAVVTLAQILWLQNDSYKEHYLIARKDRTISEHLTKLGSGRDVKRNLEANGFELYPSFIAYETKFRHLLGIPGQGALEVFNQVIGVKEVKDINSFIRRHLLEPSDTTNYIAEHLKPHFNELSGCWDAIQRDEAQLERLVPIAQRYAEFAQARATTADLQRVNQQLPLSFTQKERDLRIGFDEELEESLVELRGRKTEIEKLRVVDEEEKLSLSSAITNDKVGQRLEALDREITEALKSANIKEAAFARLKHQVGILQGTVPSTEEQFNQLRQKTLVDKGTFQGNLAAQDQKRMESAITKRELDGQRSRIAVEAESIRNNQVLIPHRLIAIRQQICEDTGLKVTDLPFTGELVEVKDEYRDWTGAIERLLHGFGISLLVPEDRYLTVSKYINAAHLGSRLDFFRVPRGGFDLRTNILDDQRRVPSRLNFKEDSQLIQWVKYEITRRFDHFCCEGVQELNQVDFGITKEGLIRNGARHTKDDSSRINDRSNFVLGWNTQAKLAALAKELEHVEQKIREANNKVNSAAAQMETLRGKISAADEILKIESFGEVNARPDQETARRLHEEHQSLKASNNKVTELQDQLEKCKLRISKHDTELDTLKNKIGGIDSKREENQKSIVRCRRVLEEKGDPSAETVTWVEGVTKGKEFTLQTLTDVQGHVQAKLNDQLKKQDDVEKRAERFLLPAMTEFLTAYPEEKADLQASTDYGPDFVKLKLAIEREQLPEHKARFFSKLNTDLLLKIATFGELLENVNGGRIMRQVAAQ